MDEPVPRLPALRLPDLSVATSLAGPLVSVVRETVHHAHWQLRDGVCAWRDWLFLNQQYSILRLHPHSGLRHTVLCTGTSPEHMDPNPFLSEDIAQGRIFSWDGWEIISHKVFLDTYLVVGGKAGQLVIMDLTTNKVLKVGKVHGTWVNSISLHTWEGQSRLIICNNTFTHTVQVYSFPEMDTITRMRVTFPVGNDEESTRINGVAVSPNGKWLVMAGDAPFIFVYSLESLGEHGYKSVRTIFCLAGNNNVSWDMSSTRFAVSSEAGCCQVYRFQDLNDANTVLLEHTIWNQGDPARSDVARGTGVTLLGLEQSGTVPLVQFSQRPSSPDTLLIFQSFDYVHVVDFRLHVRQSICLTDHLPAEMLPLPYLDLPPVVLSGGAFSSTGDRFFVASPASHKNKGCLWEFTLPAVPSLLDLASCSIRNKLSGKWTMEELSRGLPSELVLQLFPTRSAEAEDLVQTDDDDNDDVERPPVSLS